VKAVNAVSSVLPTARPRMPNAGAGLRSPALVSEPTLAQFLESLHTSWQEGEVRPTSKRKEKNQQILAPMPRSIPDGDGANA
jgi:hypothetical protein